MRPGAAQGQVRLPGVKSEDPSLQGPGSGCTGAEGQGILVSRDYVCTFLLWLMLGLDSKERVCPLALLLEMSRGHLLTKALSPPHPMCYKHPLCAGSSASAQRAYRNAHKVC